MATDAHTTAGGLDVFRHWRIAHGLLDEPLQDGRFFQLAGWVDDQLELSDRATHFGFVLDGSPVLDGDSGRFCMQPGMYFSQPGAASVGGPGRGLVISQVGYRGLFQLGGPIESQGRLRYIDGCSDTLLLSPVVKGDACLNLLYLPPATRQTAHTHPSFRAGIVVAGRGVCRTEHGCVALQPGAVFVIAAGGLHSFHTEDESLLVVAFHPDSDFGPQDDDHPMVNRTMMAGVSAARLSEAERGNERGRR
ncbi:MAG: cupin domain-containing protein [Planctomycetota bacterium]|nr:cupin domain-containing protein [Planctomycetota bacterium]